MKILVIDDEPFMNKLLVHKLARLGVVDVLARDRARDALALLEASDERIDLIFCDLQMPEMDGVEFVRHLVRIGYCGRLVLVSGEDARILQTAETLARAHKLEVLGALHKPVSVERLRQVLERTSGRPAAVPGAARKCYGADELQRAIAGGELVNHYQPKVALASGALVGVETLVRWNHPRDGLVYPDQFIETAESEGLIDDLTHTVLVDALAQARRWHDQGYVLDLAVNISMDNLGNLDFPDVVERIAADAGVALTSLTLEVTESRLMKNRLAPLDILTRLRLKRIGLSIDDFGTGHSSLAQLRDIPFSEMKIDRGFVHDACRDASLKAIFEASLGMARQLGLKTVAEGVENREDWEFLRMAGCDVAQGWFIAKPMPAHELPGWIGVWRSRCAASGWEP